MICTIKVGAIPPWLPHSPSRKNRVYSPQGLVDIVRNHDLY